MNPEKLLEATGGADSELIARADKYISPTEAYSREQKQHWMRFGKYFFVAAICLLLFFAIAKWLS